LIANQGGIERKYAIKTIPAITKDEICIDQHLGFGNQKEAA